MTGRNLLERYGASENPCLEESHAREPRDVA
jgi:hypothetical protein